MFDFLKKGLEKTLNSIKNVLPQRRETLDKTLLEEILLEADLGYDLVERILDPLPSKVSRELLEKTLLQLLETAPSPLVTARPCVDLIVGINGAGKTTTIAKLTQKALQEGQKVILGAGDTFRAAAVEQLTLWAQRLNVPIIANKQGSDPSSVAFDTINSALAKGYDRVIIDTAGRLHTQNNLAEELKKIVRVCDKALSGAPHRKILILDGTQGSSAIAQAQSFHAMIGLDGIVVTKLDGTAKGGAIFAIADALKLPILFIGVGETADALIPFEPSSFVATLLDGIYTAEEL